MSLQLSNLTFFHLLYASYSTLNKQVKNCHKPGDLVDQLDCTAYIWSHSEDGSNYLRLIMPEFFFRSTSYSYITKTLQSSDLNRLSNKKGYANI